MNIILARDITKRNAYDHAGKLFKKDQVVSIAMIGYPGERMLMGRKNHQWQFWTVMDIDSAYIFGAEDVSKVIIESDDPEANLPIWNDTPFIVERFANT